MKLILKHCADLKKQFDIKLLFLLLYHRLRKRPASGGPLAAPAEKVPLRVCTFSAGLVTHSAACQRLTCRAGSLSVVRKEKAHFLKVGVRHGLQLPDRLPGQRLHIPVHIGEGGGHAAHRPAPVSLVIDADQVFFLNCEMYHHPTSNS